jgi:hypothetical protein
MAIQTIYLGTYANDGTGDDLRVAFEKVNSNFTEIDSLSVNGAINLGSGTPIFVGKQASLGVGDNLSFRSLVAGQNISLSSDGNSVTISADTTITAVEDDLQPTLGGNLQLNDFAVVNSDNLGNLRDVRINGIKIDQVSTSIVKITNYYVGQSLTIEGTVSDISNHNLSALGNVSAAIPSPGNTLVWTGSEWAPGLGTSGGGIGNAYLDWDFIGLDGIARNPIQYLLSQSNIDMGSFASPNAITVDLGTF